MGGDVNGRFRKIIFWMHLIAGLVAGLVILIMSVTGAALAFEKEIIARADSKTRIVTPTPSAFRLSLDDLLLRVREKKPGERPSGITIESGANVAVLVSFGRTNSFYVNPYTGEVREPSGKRVRWFMQTMLTWHRFLGANEERRAIGKAITGACNAAFLFLAVSGLYLWWPRQWAKNTLRAVALMSFNLRGKARDWNWHNAVGLWCAPVLIVLTATALPISFRWAGDLIYKITGSPIPARGGPGDATPVEVPAPPPGTRPLSYDALLSAAQKEVPDWKQIVFQTGGRRGGVTQTNDVRNANSERSIERSENRGEERRLSPQAVTVTIKAADQWPLFSSTQLWLDPFTAAVLRKETFGDSNLGRKVRSWTRFLHTGEALGLVGKAVAGLASAAAALLVWTGFALAWRRFFPRGDGGSRDVSAINEEPRVQTAAKE